VQCEVLTDSGKAVVCAVRADIRQIVQCDVLEVFGHIF